MKHYNYKNIWVDYKVFALDKNLYKYKVLYNIFPLACCTFTKNQIKTVASTGSA